MRTVVDTSALLALLYPNDAHNERAANRLHDAAEQGALLVNSVVYAELAADDFFESTDDVDAFLADTSIRLEHLPRDALFAAGKQFQTYLSRRGDEIQCPACGRGTVFECPDCGDTITARQHIAADFLVGAHAERDADALLTFDDGFYRDYFEVECLSVQTE